MKQFSQLDKKLSTIFNQLLKNNSEIAALSNAKLLLNFFKTNLKPFFKVSDTGWIVGVLQGKPSSTQKGILQPQSLSINFKNIFELPSFLLPYIETLVFLNLPPTYQLTTYTKYITEAWTGDNIIVKTDGNIVYKGPSFSGITPFALSELADYSIPFANTKKYWNIKLTWTSGGNSFRASGNIVYFRQTVTAGTGCSGNPADQWDERHLNVFQGHSTTFLVPGHFPESYAIIDNLTTSTITGQGDIYEIRNVLQGLNCNVVVTENLDVPFSFPLFPSGGTTEFQLRNAVIEQFILGVWTTIAVGNQSVITTNDTMSPSATEVTLLGYVPHYASPADGYIDMITGNGASGYIVSAVLADIPIYPQATTSSGYKINEILTLTGGDNNAKIKILKVNNNGKILDYEINDAGATYSNGYCIATGGSGTNATFLVTVTQLQLINFPYEGSYTIEVFKNTNSTPLTNVTQVESLFLESLQVDELGVNNKILKETVVFRLPQEKDSFLPKYQLISKIGATVLSPAIIEETQHSIRANNETYVTTMAGVYPIAPTSVRTHTIAINTINKVYIPEEADIEYKVMLVLKNPFFSHETRKYDTSQ